MTRYTPNRRRGMVTLWAVIVLSIVGTLAGILTVQGLAQRRVAEQRQERVQALWLARSGLELAAQRLLNNPSGYEGETLELIPRSQVRITVAPVKDRPTTFRVTSEAHFPTDRKEGVRLTQERTLQRSGEKDQARITVVGPE